MQHALCFVNIVVKEGDKELWGNCFQFEEQENLKLREVEEDFLQRHYNMSAEQLRRIGNITWTCKPANGNEDESSAHIPTTRLDNPLRSDRKYRLEIVAPFFGLQNKCKPGSALYQIVPKLIGPVVTCFEMGVNKLSEIIDFCRSFAADHPIITAGVVVVVLAIAVYFIGWPTIVEGVEWLFTQAYNMCEGMLKDAIKSQLVSESAVLAPTAPGCLLPDAAIKGTALLL